MKKIFLASLLLVLIYGCDSPQRTRAPSNWVNGNSFGTNNTTLSPGNGFSPGGTSGTTPGSPSTSNPLGSSGPGFETCDISDRYHTIDIGFFGLCQNSMDESLFKFKPSLTSTNVRTCLIPTFKEANGASTYLGNPQCTYTNSNQIIEGKLIKDRPGFNTYPINGVIVMNEPLVPEYIGCMQGYVNWPRNICPNGATTAYCGYWLPRCPYGGRTNPSCDLEAKNYMSQICNGFKSRYGNSYIDIRVK
jgi:hypothetical protein